MNSHQHRTVANSEFMWGTPALWQLAGFKNQCPSVSPSVSAFFSLTLLLASARENKTHTAKPCAPTQHRLFVSSTPREHVEKWIRIPKPKKKRFVPDVHIHMYTWLLYKPLSPSALPRKPGRLPALKVIRRLKQVNEQHVNSVQKRAQEVEMCVRKKRRNENPLGEELEKDRENTQSE